MAQAAPARSYGRVFDDVAAEYDRRRPTYPEELVDRACQLAAIAPGDHVLELGCGTGQLTRSLVARNLHVTAVEPGKHLISVAARNAPGAEFVNARFEDARLPRSRFRLVFAAASFHWIDPDVSWAKAARVLVPGGTLALMQHCGLKEERDADDQPALLTALAKIAPDIAAGWPSYRDLQSIAAGVERRRADVSRVWAWIAGQDVARAAAGALFCEVELAAIPKLVEQTAEELNALLRTASFYHRMSPDQRHALEREHIAIYERLGRPIRSSTVAVLLTARRRITDRGADAY